MNCFIPLLNSTQLSQRRLRTIFLISIFALISGCASSPRPAENINREESMAEYADVLFHRQNQASSTLMVLSEDEINTSKYIMLLEAEQEMHMACQSFNEYASILSEGLNPGILLRNKIYRSLDECDSATQTLELLLEHLE
jgi:hypothetical protein